LGDRPIRQNPKHNPRLTLHIAIDIGILLICSWIIFDDFKNREVNIISLILLLIMGFIQRSFSGDSYGILFKEGLINTLIISVIFGITFLYLKKIKKIEKPSETHLGLGDYFFFLSLVFFFSTEFYILVFITMTFFSLLVGILIQFLKSNRSTIPYAGIGSLLLAIMQVFKLSGTKVEECFNFYL
jgi:hypothetical protein